MSFWSKGKDNIGLFPEKGSYSILDQGVRPRIAGRLVREKKHDFFVRLQLTFLDALIVILHYSSYMIQVKRKQLLFHFF